MPPADPDEPERRYRARERQAVAAAFEELQRALLPRTLPVLPRHVVAGRYLVAAAGQTVGGDWLDAIPLREGRVALVVGDVVGHGAVASAAMGQLRAIIVTRLHERDGDLAHAISGLEDHARRHPDAVAATVAIALLDAEGELAYVTLGHQAPFVVQPDGHVRELPPTGGRPLGAGVPPDVVPRRTRLALGEVVLLHTDGLVERPGRAAPDGLAALRHAAADAIRRPPTPADAHRTTPDRISQHVVEAMSEVGGYADDATVLAAQLRPAPVEPLRRRVPGTVAGLDELREALGTWLATLQVTDEDAVALRVALVETASNAIEHGEATEMTLDLVLRDDGVVELRLRDDGRWRVPEPSGERGLGLALARGLARELRVAHDADGTRVTFSRPVGHPIAQAPAADAPPDELEMPFALREEQRDDRLVLHVAGPVDSASAPTLEARLRRLSQGGTRPIDIDLAGTTLLASAGVRVLQSAVTTASVPPALIAPAGSPAAVVLRLVGLEHRG